MTDNATQLILNSIQDFRADLAIALVVMFVGMAMLLLYIAIKIGDRE